MDYDYSPTAWKKVVYAGAGDEFFSSGARSERACRVGCFCRARAAGKTELFEGMKALGAELGFAHIAYGMNADDAKDFRPGQRAAQEQDVLAPLAEAGLTKQEIRSLAKAAGHTLWDRPAAPCLSSRVEYGRTVTREVLEQVERAEESLRQLGFRELRVRHHGELARIEISRVGTATRPDDGDARRNNLELAEGRFSIRHAGLRRLPLRLYERDSARRNPNATRSIADRLQFETDANWIS